MQEAVQQVESKNKYYIKDSLMIGWEEFLKNYLPYILFVAAVALLNLGLAQVPVLGPVLLVIIGLPLQMCIILYYHKSLNQEVEYTDLLLGFNWFTPFVKLLLTILLLLVIILIPLFIIITFVEVGAEQINGAVSNTGINLPGKIAIGLYSPIILLFGLCVVLAPFFVCFKGMDAWPALKESLRLIKSRFWYFFSFYIIVLAINIAGGATILGIVITLPVTSIATYIMFNRVVDFDEEINHTSALLNKSI